MDALGGVEILDSQRNAFQRPALAFRQFCVGGFGHGAGLVRRLDDIGIEDARLFHGGDIGLGQFKGGEFLLAQAFTRRCDGE